MDSTGSAQWQGSLKQGTGQISTDSGALKNVPYGFNQRFEGEAGTNPEELIGAAHAACFSMALSMLLGDEADITPEKIDSKSVITLEEQDDGFAVTKAKLTATIHVPGAAEEKVLEIAEMAKKNCPISKLLDCEITLDASVQN